MDETILGGMAPHQLPNAKLSASERSRSIRKLLDRWERPLALGRSPITVKDRQALGYALARLGDEWAGLTPPPEASALELTQAADQLDRQADAVHTSQQAGLFAVPVPLDPARAAEYQCMATYAAARHRDLAGEARTAERARHERPVTVRRVDPAQTRRADFDPFRRAA
jgi:hypothetical protein